MNTLKTVTSIALVSFVGLYSVGVVTATNHYQTTKTQTQNSMVPTPLLESPTPHLAQPTSPKPSMPLPTRIVVVHITRTPSKTSSQTEQQPPQQQSNQDTAKIQQPVEQAQPTNPPAPTADTRCLIQVSGATYDVTTFRNTHSGGNIFTCGTDMTSTFFAQHNQQILQQMQRYRI